VTHSALKPARESAPSKHSQALLQASWTNYDLYIHQTAMCKQHTAYFLKEAMLSILIRIIWGEPLAPGLNSCCARTV
jgi:hypothetical protein